MHLKSKYSRERYRERLSMKKKMKLCVTFENKGLNYIWLLYHSLDTCTLLEVERERLSECGYRVDWIRWDKMRQNTFNINMACGNKSLNLVIIALVLLWDERSRNKNIHVKISQFKIEINPSSISPGQSYNLFPQNSIFDQVLYSIYSNIYFTLKKNTI